MQLRLALFLASVLSIAVPASAQESRTDEVSQVSASGWIDVLVPPRRAVMLIGLAGEGSDAAAAAAALNELDATVRRTLGEAVKVVAWGFGMGENQQIRRMFQQNQQVTTSRDFLARAGLAVFLDDPADVPVVAASLARAGVNSLQGVILFPNDEDPVIRTAITDAARLVRRNAEAIAAVENARLGSVVRLQTSPQVGANSLARFNWNDQSGVSLHAGEIMVRINVQGTWQLVR